MTSRGRLQFCSNRRPLGDTSLVEAVARSHVGKVRQINEDRFLVRSDQGLWAVADGMGGHSGGGYAATTAIEELALVTDCGQAISEATIRAAFDTSNRHIHDSSSRQQKASGTTIVAAWVQRDRLTVFWVGDSRAYRLRGSEVRCLTRDHSVVQELLDAGEISAAEAQRHPYAHHVTRALGAEAVVEVDQTVIDFRPGDRLLLCSDGVSRSLDLVGLARGHPPIRQFADDVLRNALRRDGSDNATLVAVQLMS